MVLPFATRPPLASSFQSFSLLLDSIKECYSLSRRTNTAHSLIYRVASFWLLRKIKLWKRMTSRGIKSLCFSIVHTFSRSLTHAISHTQSLAPAFGLKSNRSSNFHANLTSEKFSHTPLTVCQSELVYRVTWSCLVCLRTQKKKKNYIYLWCHNDSIRKKQFIWRGAARERVQW